MKERLAALVLAIALPAHGAGTFNVEKDLAPLRRQMPELWGIVAKAFELQADGVAMMVGYQVNAKLGGTRTGPWCVPAKPKGVAGAYTYEVCVNTDVTWKDAKGKAVDLDKAVAMEERFSSIEIRPLAK